MIDLNRERWRVLTIGVAAAVGAAAGRAVIFPFVGTAIPFLTFFPAVIAASLWAGTRGGAIAAILSLVLAPIWMTGRYGQLGRVDWLSLFFFALTCVAIVLAVRQGYRARRRSEMLREQLAETEARFRHLANTIPQLAWMARPDGYIFWYNQRWYEYTGHGLAEMEGEGWARVHDPLRVPEIKQRWKEAVAAESPWEDTFTLRRHDGTERWFLSRAMPLRDRSGKVVLWFGTNTDVTEQRAHAEERQRLLESERTARANAERASFLKDEFLATVSHELRTPLNAIMGWTQLLRDSDPAENPAEMREGLETIERNARAQTRIVEDLLEMSRMISGKTRLELQKTDLQNVVESAVESLLPTAATKHVRIVEALNEVGPIWGDPARLQQVMWNLLGNAIKFTPPGGRVQVTLRRTPERVEIAVSDNGQGIDQEFLPYVFDRFRQEESAQTRHYGGLGLGLAIVKNLVELHGGSVAVESAGANQGATFTIALPLTVLMQEAEPPRLGARAQEHPARLERMEVELRGVKVLVVDDERDSLELVRRLLTDCEAEVVLAISAEEGLRLVEEVKPHVIVSDIGMPGKDGLEMMRELRARPMNGAKIPALALTAFARSEDRTRAMLAGYQVHLAKPVEARELIAAVASLAGKVGQSGEKN